MYMQDYKADAKAHRLQHLKTCSLRNQYMYFSDDSDVSDM